MKGEGQGTGGCCGDSGNPILWKPKAIRTPIKIPLKSSINSDQLGEIATPSCLCVPRHPHKPSHLPSSRPHEKGKGGREGRAGRSSTFGRNLMNHGLCSCHPSRHLPRRLDTHRPTGAYTTPQEWPVEGGPLVLAAQPGSHARLMASSGASRRKVMECLANLRAASRYFTVSNKMASYWVNFQQAMYLFMAFDAAPVCLYKN